MILTQRDRRLLEAIYSHEGQLTNAQIGRLFFAGVASRTVRERLSILVSERYLSRRKYEHMVYWLGEKGARYIASTTDKDVKSRAPREMLISHNVLLNSWRIAMSEEASSVGAILVRWVSSQEFWANADSVEVGLSTRTVKPDGYCELVWGAEGMRNRARYLLELDKGSMSNATFAKDKVQAILSYLASPAYKNRFGSNAGVCLVATENQTKLENLAGEIVRRAGEGAKKFLLTTIDKAIGAGVLTAPIWRKANEAETLSLLH